MNSHESRSIAAAALALAIWWVGMVAPPAAFAQTTFANSGCALCHAATGARITGANSAAVIMAAFANHPMGAIGGTNINSVAADLGTIFGAAALTQTNAVNYQSGGNSIPITSLVIDNPGAVVTTTALVGANGGAIRGTASAGTPNSLNITYNHTATNCSSDTITVIGTGSADTANRTVTVNINDPGAPTANSYTAATIAYSTGVTTLTAPTLGGPAPRTLSIVAQPAGGTGTANVSGANLQYASPATYVPQATFTYSTTGPCFATFPGTATSAARTVTVNITTPAPTTLNPTTAVPFNAGGAGPTAINVPALIGAVTGVVTGVSITTPPTLGTANVVGTTVNYTPNALNATTDTFAYSTTGPGAGFSGVITITITPAVPPAVAGSSVTVPFNQGTNPQPPAATPVPLAITGFATSVNIITPPASGTLVVSGTTVSYRPNANYFGPDSFVYNAQSQFGTSPTNATVSITVTAPGLPAVANSSTDIAFNIATNPQPPAATPVALSITGFFTAVNVITPPTNGTLVPVGTSMSYRPNPNYFGPDSFVYNAQSPVGTSPTNATVSLTIATPAAPTVANRNASVAFNTATPIDLTASITGISASIAISTPPTKGTTSIAGNVVTYTPTPGYTGPDSFTYTATGPGGTSGAATVSITVQTLAPAAGAASMTVPLNTATTVDLAPFITGSAISGIAIATAPAHGSATVNGTKVTYTPVNNYFGGDSFAYTAFGNAGPSPTAAVVTVTVVGRPDPTQQPNVVGLVAAQAQAIQRFSQTQISNIGRHMERLRRGDGAADTARTQGQAPVAATPASIDPFADVPQSEGASSFRAGSADAVAARSARGSVSRNEAMSALPSLSATRGAFGVPASAVPGDGVQPRFQSHAQVASATAVSATQMDAAGAPLRVNGGGLAADLISVLTSRSVNLAQLGASGSSAQPSSVLGGTDFWIEGSVNWGNRDTAAGGGKSDFSTRGLSFGLDWRLSNQLVVGVGAGFARDRTEIGTDGTKSVAKGASVAVYGSYQPTPNTFVDAIVGAGTLNFDTDRFIAPINAFATSDRDASQIFASVAAGYELKWGGMLLSPYGRLDLSYDRLKDGAETGVGNFALHYFGEHMRSTQGALGLRLESVHETSFGWLAPRARIEFRHSFDGDHISQIAYADLIGGQRFSISSAAVERNALVAGIGGEFYLRSGLSLGLDYQLQKSFPAGSGSSQAIQLRLTQALDGKGVRPPPIVRAIEAGGAPHHDSSDIRIDAGFTYDDNVTRGRLASETLRDTSVNLALNKVELFPFTDSDNTRLMLVGSAGGDKFHSYNGLDRLFASVRAELQYRPSADFDSPMLAAFGRFAGEQFESQLRRGFRASAGVSIRYPLTDRILLFGSLAHNERYAKSSVFDTRDNALQLNVDYALSNDSTLYLAGEYRRGDIVSTGWGSLENLDIAKVFVADDAFPGQMFAYKVDASTNILTLGYNLSFGTRDSLDLSWRRARSTPSAHPGFNAAGPLRYEADQFSIVYLVRF